MSKSGKALYEEMYQLLPGAADTRARVDEWLNALTFADRVKCLNYFADQLERDAAELRSLVRENTRLNAQIVRLRAKVDRQKANAHQP